MNTPKISRNVHEAIDREFARAYRKHNGRTPRATNDATALVVLVEEVGEVARAMTYDEGSKQDLLDELVQVATMAAAWADRLMNGVTRSVVTGVPTTQVCTCGHHREDHTRLGDICLERDRGLSCGCVNFEARSTHDPAKLFVAPPTPAVSDPIDDWFRKIGTGLSNEDYEEGIRLFNEARLRGAQ